MDFLVGLYFFYTFISFYFLMLYILTYVQNKKQIFEVVKPNNVKSLSIVIPCYNAADLIGKTIEAQLNSKYEGLKNIIVVDDCSTDNSADIIKQYAKKYRQVMYIKTPSNTGNAAGAKNYGATFVETYLIGFSDDDSVPSKNAISKMVGYFNDKKVGAVTSRVLIKGNKNFLVRAQAIEYKIIAFTRKLLGFLEAIYVTNGPLSIYRKEAFDQAGGFDVKNMTEDIEITWNFVAHGWKVHMAIPAVVYTHPPTTIRTWFHQRIRWNVGGLQTLSKYKKKIAKTGMLGNFILPFFAFSWFIGITGLFFLGYRLFEYISMKILVATYSVSAEVALITMDSFKMNPNILFIFGIVLFTLGLTYTIVALAYSREKGLVIGHNILDIFIYSFFYLLMYPPLLIVAFCKYCRGYNTW
ncbi:glycosyltransferase family 2 protein [Candidatus Pacearchaeota archaeon]|nr:glycosyltransferase family 2 protein [Candidatus Pacearchaeota archaeon]